MKKLHLVVDKDAETAALSPSAALYRSIEDAIAQVAQGVDEMGHSGLVATDVYLTADSKIAKEVEHLVNEHSVGSVDIQPDIQLPQGGDILLIIRYAGNAYRAFIVRCDACPPHCFGSKGYVFRAKDFTTEDPFRGQPFYVIQEMIVSEHGAESPQAIAISQVIALCRELLYGKLNAPRNKAVCAELKRLLLEVGAAARAVMQDFDRDHYENEGWEKV